ncbi:MAG: DUF3418 domain-containing protein, partial [Actinomycetota bacterium]|nr:DUF3418 domain-containing protein [Actinomycetota bacterium]
IERRGLTDWDFGRLPDTVEHVRAGRRVVGYPALVDEGAAVAIRVMATADERGDAQRSGLRRLLLLQLAAPSRSVVASLGPRSRLTLSTNPDGSLTALLADGLAAVVDDVLDRDGGPARERSDFDRLLARIRMEAEPALRTVLTELERGLEAANQLDLRLAALTTPADAAARADLNQQRSGLLGPGFVAATGLRRLPDLARYLQAMVRRAERLPRERDVDAARAARVAVVIRAYDEARARLRPGQPEPAELGAVRWMIEELRVSLWAQDLGTAAPVSEKRIFRAIDSVPSVPR